MHCVLHAPYVHKTTLGMCNYAVWTPAHCCTHCLLHFPTGQAQLFLQGLETAHGGKHSLVTNWLPFCSDPLCQLYRASKRLVWEAYGFHGTQNGCLTSPVHGCAQTAPAIASLSLSLYPSPVGRVHVHGCSKHCASLGGTRTHPHPHTYQGLHVHNTHLHNCWASCSHEGHGAIPGATGSDTSGPSLLELWPPACHPRMSFGGGRESHSRTPKSQPRAWCQSTHRILGMVPQYSTQPGARPMDQAAHQPALGQTASSCVGHTAFRGLRWGPVPEASLGGGPWACVGWWCEGWGCGQSPWGWGSLDGDCHPAPARPAAGRAHCQGASRPCAALGCGGLARRQPSDSDGDWRPGVEGTHGGPVPLSGGAGGCSGKRALGPLNRRCRWWGTWGSRSPSSGSYRRRLCGWAVAERAPLRHWVGGLHMLAPEPANQRQGQWRGTALDGQCMGAEWRSLFGCLAWCVGGSGWRYEPA